MRWMAWLIRQHLLADSPENYSAVQLFVQRARQVQHHFSLDDNIPAVLSICRQVEGMPLGFGVGGGLAAAMSCEQIAARMASNLDFLTTPLRNIPERHRSLRVVFQQSWSLLSADEQAVLMRLAVFHGGFDLEAAAEVAGATLTVLAAWSINRCCGWIRQAVTICTNCCGSMRGEKLVEAGENDITAQRHLIYFMKLAEAGEAHAYGREQAVWYDRQEVEMDNLRAALAWSLSHAKSRWGCGSPAALRWVWEMRGHLEEGLGWFEKLLPISSEVRPQYAPKHSIAPANWRANWL